VNYSAEFASLRGQVSAQKWQTRTELAARYRLVDYYDMTDLIYNHIRGRMTMIVRNHGLVRCGATIQQTFNTMDQLGMSCRSQNGRAGRSCRRFCAAATCRDCGLSGV